MSEAIPEAQPAPAALPPSPAPPPLSVLYEALARAQNKIRSAEMNRENPHLKSKYATLASVWDACRLPLTENGLAVLQLPSFDGARVHVETILTHKSGAMVSSVLTLAPAKNDAQGIGSTITYARRYALSSIVGVCPDDDDDGTLASQGGGKQGQQQGAPVVPPPPPKSARGKKPDDPPPVKKDAEPAKQTSTAALPTNDHADAFSAFYKMALATDGILAADGKTIDKDLTRAAVVTRLKGLWAQELIPVDTFGIQPTEASLATFLGRCTADEIRSITATYRQTTEAESQAAPEPEATEASATSPAEQAVGGMFDGLPE